MHAAVVVLFACALLGLVSSTRAQPAADGPAADPVAPGLENSPALPSEAVPVSAQDAEPVVQDEQVEQVEQVEQTEQTEPAEHVDEVVGDPIVVAVPVVQAQPLDASAAVEPEAAEHDPQAWMLKHRRYSTRFGSSGGLMIEEPSSGAVGAVRLQLALHVAPKDDFVQPGNDTDRTEKSVTFSWTALEQLELYGALIDSSTSLNAPVPDTVYAQGAALGFKLFHALPKLLSFGGGLRFLMQNEPGSGGPLLKATSIGLRAGASADLRDTALRAPVLARLNLEYLFDNSAKLVEGIEAQRYAILEASAEGAAAPRNETRNLVSRAERYALAVNRVDVFTVGLGLEAPLSIGAGAALHPLLEWQMGVPVNRQDFDCALVRGERAVAGDDSCLADAGMQAWPMNLALGLRLVPPVRGLSVLAALDVALSGSSVFVRELSPSAPFALTIALGYDYDAAP